MNWPTDGEYNRVEWYQSHLIHKELEGVGTQGKVFGARVKSNRSAKVNFLGIEIEKRISYLNQTTR